jgi:hypothetical protein
MKGKEPQACWEIIWQFQKNSESQNHACKNSMKLKGKGITKG